MPASSGSTWDRAREAPPLPAFEILDVPEDEIRVSFIQRDCNWLQALEGEIDTSHFGFLHAGHVDPDDLSEDEPVRHTVTNRAPEYHLAETPWGTQYAGYREAGPGQTYWRFGNFLFPFWTQAPNGEFGSHMHARGWVPLDDGHTMFCYLWWKRGTSSMTLPQPAFKDGTPIGGTGRGNKMLPNTTDWLGRWRMAANASNDWGIDRAAQQSNTIYSGIDGIHLQDQAITESMGPIVDHEWEHLAPSDQMITRTRRRLLMAARSLRDQGVLPPGVEDAQVYRAAAAATSSATTRAPGARSTPSNWPHRCIRRRPRCARRSRWRHGVPGAVPLAPSSRRRECPTGRSRDQAGTHAPLHKLSLCDGDTTGQQDHPCVHRAIAHSSPRANDEVDWVPA